VFVYGPFSPGRTRDGRGFRAEDGRARRDWCGADLPIWLAVNRRLILASASPARRQLLEWAGLSPEVAVSQVTEDGVDDLPTIDAVRVLAQRKARAVARAELAQRAGDPPIVIGCDSMLEFDNETWGKPSSPAEVIQRWRRLRGREGLLHTGHCVIDTSTNATAAATDTAVVRFGNPDDREIEAYSRTKEALEVAGPFTLEGRSAPWIESIVGNYGTITGISLALLRRLLAEVNVEIIDLWS
jgi:septum formation protein